MCGFHACGGGYRVFLNDVWASSDLGQTWREVLPTIRALPTDELNRWRPRADHAMVIAGGQLYIIAGRTGYLRDYTYNELLNDVWASPDGKNWTVYRNESEFSPRANSIAAHDPYTNQILLVGGEELIPPSPSPSPLAARDAAVLAARFAPNGVDEVSQPPCPSLHLPLPSPAHAEARRVALFSRFSTTFRFCFLLT